MAKRHEDKHMGDLQSRLPNLTSREVPPLTAYQANVPRWSSVEKKGILYLTVGFCPKYLGNKSKGKRKVRV